MKWWIHSLKQKKWWYEIINMLRKMLMSVLKTLVKNPVKKSFNITFMENEKNYQNINCFFFSFLIKILTTTNATCDIPINTLTYPTNYHTWPSLFLSIEVIFHCSKPIFVLFNSLSLIALDLKIMKSTSKNYQFLVPSIFLFLFSLHLELFITSYWCISWTQNLKGTITH